MHTVCIRTRLVPLLLRQCPPTTTARKLALLLPHYALLLIPGSTVSGLWTRRPTAENTRPH
jgi:hypothetical protein